MKFRTIFRRIIRHQEYFYNVTSCSQEDFSSLTTFESMATDSLKWDVPVPLYRYKPWDALRGETRQLARGNGLGYKADMWNLRKLNSIEEKAFSSLTMNQIKALQKIGFIEDEWDCGVNHYEGYFWRELKEYDLSDYYEVLGYNENIWTGESKKVPATEDMWWSELSKKQKRAAAGLCYFESLWNGVDLTNETFAVPEMS